MPSLPAPSLGRRSMPTLTTSNSGLDNELLMRLSTVKQHKSNMSRLSSAQQSVASHAKGVDSASATSKTTEALPDPGDGTSLPPEPGVGGSTALKAQVTDAGTSIQQKDQLPAAKTSGTVGIELAKGDSRGPEPARASKGSQSKVVINPEAVVLDMQSGSTGVCKLSQGAAVEWTNVKNQAKASPNVTAAAKVPSPESRDQEEKSHASNTAPQPKHKIFCGLHFGRRVRRSRTYMKRRSRQKRKERLMVTDDVRQHFWFSRPELLLKVGPGSGQQPANM